MQMKSGTHAWQIMYWHLLKGPGHFLPADRATVHSGAAQDIKWFAALMEIMVQWVGYKRDDCSQNNL